MSKLDDGYERWIDMQAEMAKEEPVKSEVGEDWCEAMGLVFDFD